MFFNSVVFFFIFFKCFSVPCFCFLKYFFLCFSVPRFCFLIFQNVFQFRTSVLFIFCSVFQLCASVLFIFCFVFQFRTSVLLLSVRIVLELCTQIPEPECHISLSGLYLPLIATGNRDKRLR